MASPVKSFADIKLDLNTGTKMPSIGLGTFRMRNADEVKQSVDCALAAGYRLFDTASVYGNEKHLSNALQELLPKYDLTREDIFVTTKLSPSDHGRSDTVAKAYFKSLKNLDMDYIDLYLIHFPGTSKFNVADPLNKTYRDITWAGLVELYDAGKVMAIGVSNFTVNHLQELSCHGVMPAVNQVEWHPFYHQNELLRYCKESDIALQAYSSFGGKSCSNAISLLDDPVVKKIALKLNVTCTQVLLMWSLQQDVAVIPKSTNPEHIQENIKLDFRLPEEAMKELDALGSHNTKFAWDPSTVA